MADQVNMLAVPKQSVQLLQPDDKSKIMETAAMFENIYKMKVQEENNAYQQSLKQMKEQELAQELKRFEFEYGQLKDQYGAERIQQYKNMGYSPNSAKELLQHDYAKEFMARTKGTYTMADVVKEGDKLNSDAYKELMTRATDYLTPAQIESEIIGEITELLWETLPKTSEEYVDMIENHFGGRVDPAKYKTWWDDFQGTVAAQEAAKRRKDNEKLGPQESVTKAQNTENMRPYVRNSRVYKITTTTVNGRPTQTTQYQTVTKEASTGRYKYSNGVYVDPEKDGLIPYQDVRDTADYARTMFPVPQRSTPATKTTAPKATTPAPKGNSGTTAKKGDTKKMPSGTYVFDGAKWVRKQ
jgi:hypothetical protein